MNYKFILAAFILSSSNILMSGICSSKYRTVFDIAKAGDLYSLQNTFRDPNIKKPDINIQNPKKKNWTMLHYACKLQSAEMVQYILVNGRANPNLQDSNGRTPLMILFRSYKRQPFVEQNKIFLATQWFVIAKADFVNLKDNKSKNAYDYLQLCEQTLIDRLSIKPDENPKVEMHLAD